eukprot:GILJ01009480.1.p1 GENE.GILJ01009480.1~~GILJ01009480.1.p1  ORF type:complete len:959 (-),score=177.34 GILJ01009480.1:85-2961(-)
MSAGEDLLQQLQREVNALNEADKAVRKAALEKILATVSNRSLSQETIQVLCDGLCKPILKRFSDPVEKCREHAVNIMKEFIIRTPDISVSLPYLMAILVERLNAVDLEGIHNVPEQLRPPPSQKPTVIQQLIEPSEEIRLGLAMLVSCLVNVTPPRLFANYLDDFCGSLRALIMDPHGEVQKEACKALSELARMAPKLLFHFSEPLARSLFLPLTNRQAKVRMCALEALGQVMHCGVWKYNNAIMEALIGFRDPNMIPIKDFYEPTTKLNYFAMLVRDRTIQVRDLFYRVISDWLLHLEDKGDHEGRLFPYLLSGLSDESPEVQTSVFELIEELGHQYEIEHEKDIRELRQYGIDSPWTHNGLMAGLPLSLPFIHRPRLGSRLYVPSNVRRFLNAIYNELTDWNEDARHQASSLLYSVVVYTEEHMTQHLDPLFNASLKVAMDKSDPFVSHRIISAIALIGRYTDPSAWVPLILPILRGEHSQDSVLIRAGGVRLLGALLQGAIEVLPPKKGLGLLAKHIDSILESLEREDLIDSHQRELNAELMQTLSVLVGDVLKRKVNLGDVTALSKHCYRLFRITFDLLAYMKQLDIQQIDELKMMDLLDKIAQLGDVDSRASLFTSHLDSTLEDITKSLDSAPSLGKLMQMLNVLNLLVEQCDRQTLVQESVVRMLLQIISQFTSDKTPSSVKGRAVRFLDHILVELGHPVIQIGTEQIVSIFGSVLRTIHTTTKSDDVKLAMATFSTIESRYFLERLSPGETVTVANGLLLDLSNLFTHASNQVRTGSITTLDMILNKLLEEGQLDSSSAASLLTVADKPMLPQITGSLLNCISNSAEEEVCLHALGPLASLVRTLPIHEQDMELLRNGRLLPTVVAEQSKRSDDAWRLQVLGPLKPLLKQIVSTVVDVPDGPLKDALMNLLTEIGSRCPRDLVIEIVASERNGFLKRATVLGDVLQSVSKS